ncbi:MAG: hypothetical protein JSS27_01635 [Planctomycetes bacterium]|nr:hypothetical protein [Planctomycetota bacterium]
MASLLLHHLDDRRAVELLGRMAAAAPRLAIVNNLERLVRRAGLRHARATRQWPVCDRLVGTPPGDRSAG